MNLVSLILFNEFSEFNPVFGNFHDYDEQICLWENDWATPNNLHIARIGFNIQAEESEMQDIKLSFQTSPYHLDFPLPPIAAIPQPEQSDYYDSPEEGDLASQKIDFVSPGLTENKRIIINLKELGLSNPKDWAILNIIPFAEDGFFKVCVGKLRKNYLIDRSSIQWIKKEADPEFPLLLSDIALAMRSREDKFYFLKPPFIVDSSSGRILTKLTIILEHAEEPNAGARFRWIAYKNPYDPNEEGWADNNQVVEDYPYQGYSEKYEEIPFPDTGDVFIETFMGARLSEDDKHILCYMKFLIDETPANHHRIRFRSAQLIR